MKKSKNKNKNKDKNKNKNKNSGKKRNKKRIETYYVTLPEELLVIACSGCPPEFMEDLLDYRNHILTGAPLRTRRVMMAADNIVCEILRGYMSISMVRLLDNGSAGVWGNDITQPSMNLSVERYVRDSRIEALGYDLDEIFYNERNGIPPTKGKPVKPFWPVDGPRSPFHPIKI